MKAHGEYPKILYKSFDTLEFAQQFLSGYIRFGNVLEYKEIEDENRRDITEGTGHYSTNGKDTKIMFASNVCYALCCHKDIMSALKSKHGKYIVEISNPLHLAEELTSSLSNLTSKHFGGIEGVHIDYNKGEEKANKLVSHTSSRLTYSQKPKRFLHENEFRFVFIREEYAGSYLSIKINNPISGAIHEYKKEYDFKLIHT